MAMEIELDPAMLGMQAEAEGVVAELADAEDMEYEAMSPTGRFSRAALNSLVKAHNKVSKMFGAETYPDFDDDQSRFPTRFVREIMMIAQAVDDAIAAGEVDAEMSISLDGVSGDRDLAILTGKMDQLSKSKDFARFLKSPPEMPEMEEEVTEEEVEVEPTEEEMDQLFMGRM